MTTAYMNTVIADAPTAYYRLGESSGTVAADTSGNARTATYSATGVTYSQAFAVTTDTSTAVLLNGTSGYIDVPATVTPNTYSALTLEAWFYLPSLVSLNHDARLIANSHTDADNKGVQLVIANGGLGGSFFLGNGTGASSLYIAANNFLAATWYHLVATWDGSTMKLYINGSLNVSGPFTGPIAASGFDLNIGRNPAYTGDYFPGVVDEVAIYPTALTAVQVSTHYHAATMNLAYTALPADMLTWSKQYPWGNTATFNGEIETYLPANVSQVGQNLLLEGRNTGGGDITVSGGTYTSGMVASYNNVSALYGYIEAYIKFPAGTGVWPAFWMLYTSYPDNHEIDICEIFESGTSLNNGIHYPPIGGVGSDGGATVVPNMSTGYHLFAVDWQPTYIQFYLDGNPIRRITNAAEIPTRLMYVLLNIAISGFAVSNHIPASGQFPLQMNVQWVRIWQGYGTAPYRLYQGLAAGAPGSSTRTAQGRFKLSTPNAITRSAGGRFKLSAIIAMRRLGSGRLKLNVAQTRKMMGRIKLSAQQTRRGMGRFSMSVPTISGLTLLIGGRNMPVRIGGGSQGSGSIKVSDIRKTASPAVFDVLDPTGSTYIITERMRVSIATAALGTIYTGYVEQVQNEKAPGAATMVARTVTCVDEVYLARKRWYTGPEIVAPQPAGDIVCDLVTDYLAAEGVAAPMARRRDNSIATFAQGTLAGTAATAAGLTLPASGTTYSRSETTTANFATGTLSYTTAQNNALELTPYTAMKIVGTAMLGGGGNLLSYVKFWNGSLTINAGDTLSYDIYVSTTSPDVEGGVDLLFDDGSDLRDTGSRDILGVAAHPSTSLNGFADDKWYHRNLNLQEMVGKTVMAATLGLEGEKNGTYTYYVKNVAIVNSSFAVRTTMFSSSLQANQQIANAGYINVLLSTVTAYYHQGTRISPVASLASVGIIADSLISWTSTPPVQMATNSSKTYAPSVLIESSFDNGATWQTCTNHADIPSLLPGLTATSISLLIRQTLSLGGPSPETTPQLMDLVLTVTSAAQATKSDVADTDFDSTSLTTGTLTNLQYVTSTTGTGLCITGKYRNWDDGSVASQTMYSNSPVAAIMDVEGGGSQHLRCDTNNDVRTRLDFAGQWQDFIAEFDFLWDGTIGNANMGLVYRTTHWENNNLTYAFVVEFSNSGIELHYGSNSSGTGTNVAVATASVTWVQNTWYHMKVIVSGTSHQIFINDYRYLNATTSQYNQSGYLGLRFFNSTGIRHSGFFDNFGVQSAAFSGTRITNALSLAAVGVVENSVIEWTVALGGTAALLIEASTDGGTTYLPCTNGAVIPGLLPGTNVSSKTLKLRQTFTTSNANMTPYLTGCSVYVVGNFAASGTRISPAIPLALAGVAGSSSLTWDASIPTGATALFATSTDGTTWATTVNSGDPIAALQQEGQPTIDEYGTNTSSHYTSTFYTGGVVCTPTFDTANSRLQLVGGTNALYVWNDISGTDVTVSTIIMQAEQGGMLLRYANSDNWYSVQIRDSGASANAQTVMGIKRVGGVNTTYQSTVVIDFVRGTYHRVTFQIKGNVLTFTWDGLQVFSVTDASLSAAGKVGYVNLSGTAIWQRIRATVNGQNVLAMNAYSKVTLTSSDPRVSPVVRALTETVRNPSIQSGAMIPSTAWSYAKKINECLDDLALQSIGWWGISYTKQLSFLLDVTTLSPDVITSADLLDASPPQVILASPTYCNKQYVIGGINPTPVVETRVGNNYTLAWPLIYPIDSIESITVNNVPMLFGIAGTDTGRDYYYTVGNNILSQSITDLPLADTDVMTIAYTGQVQAQAMSQNTAQQAIIAALDNSTGIVESVLTVAGLTLAACQTKADALIAQNAQLARLWTFVTRRAGLASGQELTVFIPELNLMDATFVITDVETTLTEESGVVVATYTVTVTDGPDVGHWGTVFIS